MTGSLWKPNPFTSPVGYSPQHYPTGRIVVSDNMAGTNVNFSPFLTGSGTVTMVSTDSNFNNGNKCLALKTTALANDAAEALKEVGMGLKGVVGFEFKVAFRVFPTGAGNKKFQFGIERRGTNVKSASFWYLPQTAKFQFASASGTPDTDLLLLGGTNVLLVTNTPSHVWYSFKIWVDFTNLKYVAFAFGDTIVDMTGTALGSFASTEQWLFEAYVWLKNGTDADACDVRVSDFVMTVAEPGDVNYLARILQLNKVAIGSTIAAVT